MQEHIKQVKLYLSNIATAYSVANTGVLFQEHSYSKKHQVAITVILVAFLAASCNHGYSKTLSDSEIDMMLSKLKPLPKVHYSFCNLGGDIMDDPKSRRLYEYTRITHALTFWGEWVKQEQLDKYVYTCARVNKTNPKIPVSVAAGFRPWHRKFGKDLPPTDRGPTYYEEIRYFSERLQLIRKWLAAANRKYGSKVKLSAILLDSERFHVVKGNNRWNEGLREALDAIHMKARSIFPEARIEWYARGVRNNLGPTGWFKRPGFTGREIKAPLSCSLYTLPELLRMREAYRRTCQLADDLRIEDVTPWVALAAGYRRGVVKNQYWDRDWRFDVIHSYQIGAELNLKQYGDKPKRYAPYNRAKVIIFYPPAFAVKSPDWARHFIAYVRGATGIKELKDLGFGEEE